jgi:hypothetical protein
MVIAGTCIHLHKTESSACDSDNAIQHRTYTLAAYRQPPPPQNLLLRLNLGEVREQIAQLCHRNLHLLVVARATQVLHRH